jgi:hypothetical protein
MIGEDWEVVRGWIGRVEPKAKYSYLGWDVRETGDAHNLMLIRQQEG